MHENTETTAGDRTVRGRARDTPAGRSTTRPARRTILGAAAGVAGLRGIAGVRSATRGGNGRDPATRDVMVTCNAKDGSVTLIDATTYDPIRTIQVYPDEDEDDALEDSLEELSPVLLNALARENYVEHANVSPDGRTLYVARGHVGDVVAIDVETGRKRWETELAGLRADHQRLSSDGKFLYTSDITVNEIVKIDAETGDIVATGTVRDLPHGIHYHRLPAFDGEEVLINGSLGNVVVPDSTTGDPMEHRLTFLDPETMETLRTVDFEEGVRPIAVSDDGRKIYVQLSYFHGFHEYDTVEDRLTRTRHLPRTEHVPDDEDDYPLQSAHHGIDISGNGEYICVAGTTSWYAAIVRRSDFELIGTVPVGEHPYWVETAPDGEHAFVPVRGEDEVVVVSYEDAEEVARTPVGAEPHVTEYGAIPEDRLSG